MHEVGHALGLKHGHVTQFRSDNAVNFPTLPTNHNSYEYSVMTYSQYVGDAPGNGDNAPHHPTSLMMDDIAALQYLYGADYGTNNSNTIYTFSTTTGEMFINGVGQGAADRQLHLADDLGRRRHRHLRLHQLYDADLLPISSPAAGSISARRSQISATAISLAATSPTRCCLKATPPR